MEIKRREFLRLVGGLSGAAALGGCALEDVFNMPREFVERARSGPGVETWKNTVCSLCPGGCGMRVRLVDGTPVSVKGNPLHPVSQGGLCPLGLNALHLLYHPDRLQGPVKRLGKPTEGRWEPVGWDAALGVIGSELATLRKNGMAHQVAFLGTTERGLLHDSIARFMRAYGSPNHFTCSSLRNDSVPFSLLHGHPTIPAYDLLNAKLVLSFGANFLEDGYSPVYYTKIYSRHRERETRYIQIEPRLSLTGSNAERWIPIRPGTYGALALGLAYVLIREEMIDAPFVAGHTFGYEDWTDRSGAGRQGFRTMVLGNYYPERVSEITGVSSAQILELGRDLGTTRPAVVLGDQGAIDNTNGTFSMMAIQSLNALLGNYAEGRGVFFVDEPPFTKLRAPQQDSAARKGCAQPSIAESGQAAYPLSAFAVDSFVRNVLADQPYPLRVLFIHGGNPLFQSINQHGFAAALRKIPLVVSFDSIINETSEYAHLVLPEHTFLEQWEEVSNVPSVGFTHVSIQQPVVEPLYQTRHVAEVFSDLATRIGGTLSGVPAAATYKEAIRHRARGLYESGEGAILNDGVKQFWYEYLQQRGWQIGRYSSFDEFWSQLLDQGGWWNPIRRGRGASQQNTFRTRSGKFEFYSQTLRSVVDGLVEASGGRGTPHSLELVLNQLNISARGDPAFLPHYEPVPYEADMPLHLVTFQVAANRDGQGACLPMIQEIAGYSARRFWQSWVEIHPETAASYGISDGAWVWLVSSAGSIRVRAMVAPTVSPNVVAVPFGLGHTSYGRYARGHGVNPNLALRDLYDRISGKPALEGTKVRISTVS